ncbi:MAG: hypothetical protein A2Y38_16225 [Spirochaetes bacterium GWB1_59_5]|nr:MAG: hypothetical protein A2Y38_16225 [Spirochaetes bacterium GWB1_59_5]
MTVASTDNSKRFHGTGGTGPFTWVWRFLANTDISVYIILDPDEDNPSMEIRTLLVEGDDYVMTGAGSYTGGSLVTTDNILSGTDLYVERNTAPLQEVSIRNQGNNFRPEIHENVFDRLTMMSQDGLRRIASFEADVDNLGDRSTSLEFRVTATEGDIATLFDRETTVIVTPGQGEAGDMIVHADASVGNFTVNVVAANDPAARPMLIGKIDGTTNFVIFTPAAGTVMNEATYEVGAQNEYKRFIPRASDNMWIVA